MNEPFIKLANANYERTQEALRREQELLKESQLWKEAAIFLTGFLAGAALAIAIVNLVFMGWGF